ncbi:2-amino-4-hydroxy-6-hydroxymethyldihydropteridine diphosphokinase [Desulfovibrionales bacterium]
MSDCASHIVYVSLGSNMGTPADNVEHAVAALNAVPGFAVTATSDVYVTEPQGLSDQPWFANMVACMRVDPGHTPDTVLTTLLRIEADMGRVRTTVWGPRIIDLDLLLFDDLHVCSTHLHVPHPRMRERAFVLVPLLQLAPDLFLGTERVADLLAALSYTVQNQHIWQSAPPAHLTFPNHSGHTR